MSLADSRVTRQTSAQSGNILAMGKGFDSCQGVEGQDLKYLIVEACRRAVRLLPHSFLAANGLTLEYIELERDR